MNPIKQQDQVLKLFSNTPVLRSHEITVSGIDPKTIQRMLAAGDIIRISRGVYALPDYNPESFYFFAEAQKIVKQGIICLLSALVYHEIGTQNPSLVWMAIPGRSRAPQIGSGPIQLVRFSESIYKEGIIERKIEGVNVRIYNIPKTIADCFKYRNKLGIDLAIEVLKDAVLNRRTSVDEILHFADICRVRNVMTPYLETIL